VIEFRSVRFSRRSPPGDPGRPVIEGLDLNLEKGLLHVLVGPSGCGKTTLLYLAAGLLSPDSGEVLVAGEPARPGRKDTAVVLQDHGLFPWKTVLANLELGLALRGLPRRERKERSLAALEETGLLGQEKKYPRALSGGERQRLAIARALVLSPDLLLLDEPFSSLDAITRESLQDRLLSLVGRERSLTTVMVTHDIAEAAFLADRIHVMNRLGKMTETESGRSGTCAIPRARRERAAGFRSAPEFFALCDGIREALR